MRTPQLPEALATRTYFDREFGRQAVKLLPNEYYVTREDMVLTTVLGSCVAACIRDETAGVGGMNHFMLPDDDFGGGGGGGGGGSGGADRMLSASMRYGSYALEVLINELLKMGARRERLEAKVFGGGAVLANMTTLNIGDRNADFVLRYLKAEEIRVAAQDLRGPHARRVSYFPTGGLALVRRLTRQDDQVSVAREESALARAITTSAKAPPRTPELFARQFSTRQLP
ncbi:chemoreceptor glutamine deamidase CheD [Cupriavidus necator]|uniref:chemoreceptor glutamine deamidase CheD n=1 Tax=Cupriavidus necator TaxID=106590 RepID=UPI0005B478D4|nr:chemoreceptor glutamine deamidase CheD [Cupriavidus necator]